MKLWHDICETLLLYNILVNKKKTNTQNINQNIRKFINFKNTYLNNNYIFIILNN